MDNDLLDYLINKEVFEFQNGYVKIINGPGLGIIINEKRFQEMAKKSHQWRNPV